MNAISFSAQSFENWQEEQVEGREAMCVMTSNIFGAIAADNLGYARVQLQDTIARGAKECIVVSLVPGSPIPSKYIELIFDFLKK